MTELRCSNCLSEGFLSVSNHVICSSAVKLCVLYTILYEYFEVIGRISELVIRSLSLCFGSLLSLLTIGRNCFRTRRCSRNLNDRSNRNGGIHAN